MIEAKIICDSVSPQGHRLTTMQLRYPKFIHGEFMTHRVFSRNASSSRAIPTAKLIEEVRSDALRAVPVWWGKNQSGMQAAEELKGEYLEGAKLNWKNAAFLAAGMAENLNALGTHKQIVNRLLEPFSHINVVVTATEYDNFFGLRLHKDAQPEMRALAVAMWGARKVGKPNDLKPGEWHLPFVDKETWTECQRTPHPGSVVIAHRTFDLAAKVSVARCARVSYLSFETGKRSTIEEDLKLYDRLMGAQPLHASPAEHPATPDVKLWDGDCWEHDEQHGNFVGWRQYRKMLSGEAIAPLPEGF